MKLPWHKDNSNQSGLPPEVQQYYQANRKERTSVAWLLAFATLAVTVIVAFGVFFTGRWVYRKIAGNDKPTAVVTTPAGQIDDGKEPKPAEPEKPVLKPKKQRSAINTPITGPSTDLADTGPGDILAAFIISVVIGTTFYEFKLHRKTN